MSLTHPTFTLHVSQRPHFIPLGLIRTPVSLARATALAFNQLPEVRTTLQFIYKTSKYIRDEAGIKLLISSPAR